MDKLTEAELDEIHAFVTSPDDLELNVMEQLRVTLEPFDRRTRKRILTYLYARFVADPSRVVLAEHAEGQ